MFKDGTFGERGPARVVGPADRRGSLREGRPSAAPSTGGDVRRTNRRARTPRARPRRRRSLAGAGVRRPRRDCWTNGVKPRYARAESPPASASESATLPRRRQHCHRIFDWPRDAQEIGQHTQALGPYLCHDARSRGPARAPLGGLRGRLRAQESDAASESAARAAGGPVHGGRRAPRRHPLAAADQPVAAGPGAVAARLHGAAALPPRQRRARPRRFDACERRARGLAKPPGAGTRRAARRCSTSSSRGIGRCTPTSS